MQQANPQTTTTTAKSPQSQTFTETPTSPEIESTIFENINERLDQYENGLNDFRGFLQTVDTDAFAGYNRLLKRIHRLEDELVERLDRHRVHINTLRDMNRDTNERATATNETHDRQIQALKQSCEKIPRPFSAYNEGQMASNLNRLTENERHTRDDVFKLENIVTALNLRIEKLEEKSSKTCKSCNKTFQPVKISHQKCKDCYMFDKMKTCSSCKCKFVPHHSSYKVCPKCYKNRNSITKPP